VGFEQPAQRDRIVLDEDCCGVEVMLYDTHQELVEINDAALN